jgi:2-polyprenyl-6-methoxyphenol hydroxylase-like FAD-dependent oxidoreductase
MDDFEVVIVGAGPVGLCLALLLARSGVQTVVFEKLAVLEDDLRASTFHPPTLDMLATLGITESLMARGLVCPHWQIRLHPYGDRAVFDLSVLKKDTAYPFRLQCEQWKLSQALLAALEHEPRAQVHFGVDVAGLDQDDSGVTLRFGDGRAPVRGRYLVGADGAHSIVRKTIEQNLDGKTYPETTLLVTTRFAFEDHLEGLSNVSYCWTDGGNFSLLKVPGRWRVSIYPKEGVPLDDQLSDVQVEAVLQGIVARDAPYEVMEKRPYRVHQRIVDNYVSGRAVLVGDAAHLNAPSGGMGLNGGIHDAFELADALTDILRGGAGASRLALYDRRRRPVARDQILAQADANRARMRERDMGARREILAGLQAICADPVRLHAHVLRSSMIEGLRMSQAIS